jgi:heptosyltransferase-1
VSVRRVLLVKMSSLGDLVHALPAVTDAAAHGISFDWVVEEAFAALPARHPAVARVLPIAWRRWRHRLWRDRGELRAFFARLRQERYDLVLDAQGLVKSAVVSAAAQSAARAGFDWQSARESLAALAVRHRIFVPREAHAIARQRALFAGALQYSLPQSDAPLDFGISAAASHRRRELGLKPLCLLLHGTTWASKQWPESYWCELAWRARDAGFEVALPAGTADEAARAERIASASHATAWPRVPLAALLDDLAGADLVIGVDSGLLHASAALGVPTVGLYLSTDAERTGCLGPRAQMLRTDFPCAPCGSRACGYRGPRVADHAIDIAPICATRLTPARVWAAAESVYAMDRTMLSRADSMSIRRSP